MTHPASLMTCCLLVGCAVAPTAEAGDTRTSIVGGQATTTAKYPTVVAVLINGGALCTGTLVHPSWVVTAGHCIPAPGGKVTVVFDDADLGSAPAGKAVAAKQAIAHPDYRDDVFGDNDIGLLELVTPVTDREPTPIHRPRVPLGTSMAYVGFGRNRDSGGSGVLREVTQASIKCGGNFSDEKLVCNNSNDGNGTCQGDSGGPAYINVGGKLELAAVTAFGGASCESGYSASTAIYAELPFLDKHLPKLETPPPPPSSEPVPAAPVPTTSPATVAPASTAPAAPQAEASSELKGEVGCASAPAPAWCLLLPLVTGWRRRRKIV